MIGDLILALKTAMRQLTCDHDYLWRRSAGGVFTWRECTRCDRKRDWSSHL